MTTTNTNDWSQVVTNLETQLETGYNYGLAHDLTIARVKAAEQADELQQRQLTSVARVLLNKLYEDLNAPDEAGW